MARTSELQGAVTPSQDRHATESPNQELAAHGARRGRLTPFWRHFLEMLGVMVVGMIATGAIFLSMVGLKSWDEVTALYPTEALLAMAGGMTLPMMVWMVYRGMGWRNSVEMAAVMVLPVIPFLCFVWFGITKSAMCGAYCLVTVAAMFGLVRWRREEYVHSMHAM